MNTRIQSLAVEAGLFHRLDDGTIYPTALTAEESAAAYTAFADMIVKECSAIAWWSEQYDMGGDVPPSKQIMQALASK